MGTGTKGQKYEDDEQTDVKMKQDGTNKQKKNITKDKTTTRPTRRKARTKDVALRVQHLLAAPLYITDVSVTTLGSCPLEKKEKKKGEKNPSRQTKNTTLNGNTTKNDPKTEKPIKQTRR